MELIAPKFCLECDEAVSPSAEGREELIEAAAVRVIKEPWWWRLPLIGKHFRPIDIAY
jgi:hypothetical protein